MNFETLAKRLGRTWNKEAFFYLIKGDEEFDNGNLTQAIFYFSQAIELYPENWYPYFKRGLCFRILEEYDKALLDLKHSRDLSDTFENNQTTGECYLYKKNFQTAIKFFSKAICHLDKLRNIDLSNDFGYDYDATKARVLNNQAFCHFKLKNYRSAIDLYTFACRICPSYLNPLIARCGVYFETEKFEAALNDSLEIEKMRHFDPKLSQISSFTKQNCDKFFQDVRIISEDLSNENSSRIQVEAFTQELDSVITEINTQESNLERRYELKVMVCSDYFRNLWNNLAEEKKNIAFMGFVCYNIAKAVSEIDIQVNYFEMFVDLISVLNYTGD